MPTLCLRFDVDSHRCLEAGVPALLDLLDAHGATATFFVNMGRLTSRPRMARRRLAALAGRDAGAEAKDTLPLAAKLGAAGIRRVVATNPRVGGSRPDLVAEIARRGSEVGLHGGRAHRLWQDDAPSWDRDRVRAEVRWGLAALAATGAPRPAGFSSPGWAGSPVVDRVLREEGFAYVADDHGHRAARVVPGDGLVRVTTNLVGEPGGVGWLEWHRARGHDDEQVVADLDRRLAASGDLAVLYDHPFHAGLADLRLLDRLLGRARARGWRTRTLGEVARQGATGQVDLAR